MAIYTINIGGGGKYRVTEGNDPSYSPDGKRIAYASNQDGNENESLIANRSGRRPSLDRVDSY